MDKLSTLERAHQFADQIIRTDPDALTCAVDDDYGAISVIVSYPRAVVVEWTLDGPDGEWRAAEPRTLKWAR